MDKVINKLKILDFIKQNKLKYYPGIYEEKKYINWCDLTIKTQKKISDITYKYCKLFHKVSKIDLSDFNILEDKIFIVGGFIRDVFADFPSKDIDLVTSLSIEELIKLYPKADLTGKHFGVLRYKGFEIATFRKDLNNKHLGATDTKHSTFEEDYKRRDFTFNALYFNIKTKKLLDPTGKGILDSINKEINFIGNPKDRINEDVIRLLRILKFKKKGFNISNKTLKSFRTNFSLLCQYGNPERIREHIEDLIF